METLKQYLARFNATMVQVDDPDQKFFIKAFQKGLRAGPFSDSLALSRLSSMTEIRARAEKHVEAEEDKEDRLQVERVVPAFGKKNTHNFEASHQAHILKEVCHLKLLDIPPPTQRQIGPARDEWCEFHKTHDHVAKECRLLKSQIEKLIQEGHLDQFVARREDDRRPALEQGPRNRSRTPGRDHDQAPEQPRRQRGSSPRNAGRTPPHRGTITTIARGGLMAEMSFAARKRLQGGVVLVDQTFRKTGFSKANLKACQGTLIRFTSERAEIRGVINLQTTIGTGSAVRAERIKFTMVNAPTSYNVILGRPALNRFKTIVSTIHLCMKYPMGRSVGRVAKRCYDVSTQVIDGQWRACSEAEEIGVHFLEMDPRFEQEGACQCPGEDLKEIQVGLETDAPLRRV
ncbi:hypothetical protein CR513_51254, partial [Mucuna pruriens]